MVAVILKFMFAVNFLPLHYIMKGFVFSRFFFAVMFAVIFFYTILIHSISRGHLALFRNLSIDIPVGRVGGRSPPSASRDYRV